MTDKPKKFEEILKFVHNFNNNTVDLTMGSMERRLLRQNLMITLKQKMN